MGDIKKRKIVEVLREMCVGDVELFPIEQFSSVRSTAQGSNLLKERKVEGKRWTVNFDNDKLTTVVTRVQ